MNQLDKILYVVAPVIGIIGPQGLKEYNSVDQDQNDLRPSLKTADELITDFSNDENDANEQYHDQVIRVSGTIKSIQQNKGIQTIFLSTSSTLSSVICHFREDRKDQLNQLRPWHAIVVKGVCRGVVKHVVLEQCELEQS